MVVVVGNLLGSDNGGILGIGEQPVGDFGLCSSRQWGRDSEIPPGLNCIALVVSSYTSSCIALVVTLATALH